HEPDQPADTVGGSSHVPQSQHSQISQVQRPVFMPESFTGSGRDWFDWSEQFEMAAEVNGWNDAFKLKFMSLLLTGRARDIYSGLAIEEKSSYPSLKAALTKCFQPCDSAEWNRVNFIGRKRLPQESAREYGNTLRRLVIKAYPTVGAPTQDLLAKDHFIANVGSAELRIQLRTAKLETLEEAINVASELELIRGLEQSPSKQPTQVLVNTATVLDSQMHTLLGVVEGLRQDVKTLQNTVKNLQSRVGESFESSKTIVGERAPERGVCWECGCNRHIKRDCPYLKGN
ncbi:hypothetical protein SRHO_G00025600, partial [Serrasalmus rhombeus]